MYWFKIYNFSHEYWDGHNFSNEFLLNYRYLRKWMYIIPNVYAKNEGHLLNIVIWKGKVTQSIWHKWFYFYTIKMILEKTLCLEAHLYSIFRPIQEYRYDASFVKDFYNQNDKIYLLKRLSMNIIPKNILFWQKYFVKQFYTA